MNLASSWIHADWPAPAHVRALTTVREGGVSTGAYGGADSASAGLNLGARCGDDACAVQVNRARLQTALPARPQWLQQVHGVAVVQFHASDVAGTTRLAADSPLSDEPIADAAITVDRGVVLSVLTADCLPVFVTHRHAQVVAVCHAGWRGLAAGVIEATLAAAAGASGQALGDDWLAHLGPCIGPEHFEVGEDVHRAFCFEDPGARECFVARPTQGKYLADLYGLARRRLKRAGLQSISGGAYCTYRDRGQFYSHRRDRVSGRMASLIWIEQDGS